MCSGLSELLQLACEMLQILHGRKAHLQKHGIFPCHAVAFHHLEMRRGILIELFFLFLRHLQLNQIPRCKQRGIKLVALQSSGVFDPRGSRQISAQVRLLGSLLAGIKKRSQRILLRQNLFVLSRCFMRNSFSCYKKVPADLSAETPLFLML